MEGLINGGAYSENRYFKTNHSSTDEIQVLHLLVLIKLKNIIKRTWQPTCENWPPL